MDNENQNQNPYENPSPYENTYSTWDGSGAQTNTGYGENTQWQQGANTGYHTNTQWQQGVNTGYHTNAQWQQGTQYQTYGGPHVQKSPAGGNELAIVSMVCGIISIVICCVFYLSGPLAVIAVVLGIVSLSKQMNGKGMAIAGIVTGSIGVLLALAMVLVVLLA